MKTKNFFYARAGLMLFIIINSATIMAQKKDLIIKNYLTALPDISQTKSPQRFRMTAIYTNRDLYGNFTGKTKVSGEYTRRINGDSCRWNNVLVSSSAEFKGSFPEGKRQEYIEGYTYLPTDQLLDSDTFKDFPPDPVSVLSRNLIWDMKAIEDFAWNNFEKLRINETYSIPDSDNEFQMGNIGSYSHSDIILCWTGISVMNGILCALIEFRATDNKLALSMEALKTKGTEQYWGTIWISLEDKSIEHAEMYGGTIQEIEVTGMENKFLVKTIRDLWVDKIL